MALLLVGLLAGCGGHRHDDDHDDGRRREQDKWLCPPAATPTRGTSLATTVIRANGSKTIVRPARTASPPIDCFYVYPTVSDNRPAAPASASASSDLVAETQTAQFSRVCKVYAPVYRQIMNRGLVTPSLLRSPARLRRRLHAWRDYLAHWNPVGASC